MARYPQPLRMTAHEYLAFEEAARDKHEFYYGEVYAIAGGSILHGAICAGAITSFSNRLTGKGCVVLSSDSRVRNSTDTLYTYPDLTIFCGKPEISPQKGQTLSNPILIVEVHSPSTRLHDSNRKVPEFKRIASLQYIVLLDSEAIFVQVQSRQADDSWRVDEYFDLKDEVAFPLWDLSIPVSELYGPLPPEA